MTAVYLYICVPVFCCIVCALPCLLIRHGRRKEAVCWFCHCKQAGNYHDNGWTCGHCQQYNGFTEDGGYDREMTEQYADGADGPIRYCSRGPNGIAPPTSSLEILCAQCQLNLHLKMAQLAAFQPTCEESFEQEAGEYECLVEKLYPLCSLCERRVTNEINHRNHMIRQHFLASSSGLTINRGNIKSTGSNAGRRWWLLRILDWSAVVISVIGAMTLLTHSNCCGDSTIARCTTPLDTEQLLHFQTHTDRVRILPQHVSPGGADFLAQLPSDGNGTCPVGTPSVQLFHISAGMSNQFDRFNWLDRLWCVAMFTCCWLARIIVTYRTTLGVLLLLVDIILWTANLHTRRVGMVLGVLDVANVLVSCNGGLHLLAGNRVEPVCGGLLATISVLRLSYRLPWRWKVVKQQRAVVELGDQKTREQQTIQSSFGGLCIGRQCHGDSPNPKSWLKTLEEMELLPGNRDNSTWIDDSEPVTSTSSSAGLTALSLETSCDEILELPASPGDHCEASSLIAGNGKPILRPAKFHHRRYSISSATAALSLSDSSQGACPSPPPLLASPQSHTHLCSPTLRDPFTPPEYSHTPRPVNSNGYMMCNGVGGYEDTLKQQEGHGLPRRRPKRKARKTWCSNMWCVSLILMASVSINLLLLAVLFLHLPPLVTDIFTSS